MQNTKIVKGNLTGRRKGVGNKITLGVKTALADAFHQLGGIKGLVEWGQDNRGEFYKLWVKLLPPHKDNKGEGGLTIQIMQFGHDTGKIIDAAAVEIPATLLSGKAEKPCKGENAEAIPTDEES